MSLWGKIIGGGVGFAVGGPLGAIIGTAAGHAFDKQQSLAGAPDEFNLSAAFTIAVVVLGAKMAKADGVVTKDEIRTFKDVFKIPAEDTQKIGKIFNHARQDSGGFEPYAIQIADMYQGNRAVLEELLHCLSTIATADGNLHRNEITYLKKVSDIFGIGDRTFKRITAIQTSSGEGDPFQILGLDHQADDATLKTTYRALVRENHPDKLIAEGLPEEFIEMANKKLAAINNAYDQICKQRGLN
jgi:DnaJ like chaperone protein